MDLSIENKKIWKIKLLRLSRIFMFILLLPPIIIAGFFAYASISRPIINNISKDRYEKMNSYAQSLYQDIKAIAGDDESWEYTSTCERSSSGAWEEDDYVCSAKIRTEKIVTSSDEVLTLNKKYELVIDNNEYFSEKSNEKKTKYFGAGFYVSALEYEFKINDIQAECDYYIQLGQTEENKDYQKQNYFYGGEITSDVGSVLIKYSCFIDSYGKMPTE